MSNYDIRLVKEFVTNNKKLHRFQIEFKRKDKKMMSLDEINKIYKEFVEEENLNEDDIMIVGLNQNRYFTLKSLNQDDFTEFDEDYLENKPKEVKDMLKEFYSFEFILLK